MNCGMPTDSAARRPYASSTVALRSFDWFRIGVVAVRETYSAISKQTVSMPPANHLGGDGIDALVAEMRARLPASRTRSTLVMGIPRDRTVSNLT